MKYFSGQILSNAEESNTLRASVNSLSTDKKWCYWSFVLKQWDKFLGSNNK